MVLGAGEMQVEMRVNGDPMSALPNAASVLFTTLDPNLPLRDPDDTTGAIRRIDLQASACSRGLPFSSDCWRACWLRRDFMARWPTG